jgi:GTPase SAR1 family protein
MGTLRLSLFISYSHHDENCINEFIKHTRPLIDIGNIELWHDRKIIAGNNFQKEIDMNLENADIICLFISANFLSSNACLQEKKTAFHLRNRKGVAVVPIILSSCGWLDDSQISNSLAIPTDGKPIDSYPNVNTAWNEVYVSIKSVIEAEIRIKQLEFSQKFLSFLNDAELLTKAHSNKEKVCLEDIFIFPDLTKYDDLKEYEKDDNSENLVKDFYKYSKILLAGENQSGKTSLCKKIIYGLRKDNYVPIYISDKNSQFKGKIETRIHSAFREQYTDIDFNQINKTRIVPIIDDFHFAKDKERHINDLSNYSHQIIIVDDIFSLNIKNENLIRSFTHFKIKELRPSLRNKLIEKWLYLSDQKLNNSNGNEIYQRIDSTTELVNDSLGKIIGSGIMPAYPFFILSVMSTQETFGKSIDQEITSQGHCYQALIYLYLTKAGVKNEDIDTYINFLTELAFFIYKESKYEISNSEFNEFMSSYLDEFNLPIKQEALLVNLENTKIIKLDNFNNYAFCYPYLYYFFVAKYLSEHIDGNQKIIDQIIGNLHKDENAYIAIFISHHSRKDYILEEIVINAYTLFDQFKPADLSKDEVNFFDIQLDKLLKEKLPSSTTTPEIARAKRLEVQDHLEQNNKKEENDLDEHNSFSSEIRRSVKTVEVMGRIIKNRSGSLKKERLELIFEEAMKVQLRILSSFFEAIKTEENELIRFIVSAQ